MIKTQETKIPGIKIQAVTGELTLEVIGALKEPSAAARQRIDEIWALEKARRGDALFDGTLLSLDEISVSGTGSRLRARVASYRAHVAQLREPRLFGELGVRAIGVSGLVTCEGTVAFGRRAAGLTQEAGLWELVPSGGLEPRAGDDLVREQFLCELEEELGVPRAWARNVEPFLVAEDLRTRVIDVVVAATLDAGLERARQASGSRSDEYTEIRWLARAELAGFCSDASSRGEIVDLSMVILSERGLI